MTAPRDEAGGASLAGAREHVVGNVVSFVRALRRGGVAVPENASVDAVRALAEVGLSDRSVARAALQSALLTRPADRDAFDQQFPAFWHQLRGEDEDWVPPEQRTASPVPSRWETPPEATSGAASTDPATEPSKGTARSGLDPVGASSDAVVAGEPTSAAVYSPVDGSRTVPGMASDRSDSPLAVAVGRVADAIATLRSRRWTRTGHDRVDTRQALRRSVGTGGAVLSIPHRGRQHDAVRATLLVDVSQSVLDTIERDVLLEFLRASRREWRDARIFFFDTSLREVSTAFDAETTADAAAALERAEAAWGGGTRIGSAFETVRQQYPDAVDRNTVVFVISDGLEVGELDVLERGASWLSRRAESVLWLNPLAASVEYEPTCRGMARALPFVDGLFAFSGADDVEEIARQLERRGFGGPLGYEHDRRHRELATETEHVDS